MAIHLSIYLYIMAIMALFTVPLVACYFFVFFLEMHIMLLFYV